MRCASSIKLVLALAIAVAALSLSGGSRVERAQAASIALQQIAGPSDVSSPVGIANADDGTNRLFFVNRAGVIKVHTGGVTLATEFIDLTDVVLDDASERGLLNVIFHPNYESNRFFYVYYTAEADPPNAIADGDIVVARYTANPGGANTADPNSAVILLTIPHPGQNNHNGGAMAFGPDGNLYLGVGDGGAGGDPPDNAENINVLLGKILRLNVNIAAPYVPATNPYVGIAGRDEIWAIGVRNPWRISFDASGNLFVADVGQGAREEVNFAAPGEAAPIHYGWNTMEGSLCYPPEGPQTCDQSGKKLPVMQYDHGSGCSITGGYRYAGSAIPAIANQYVFGDFCSGNIWGGTQSGPSWLYALLLDTSLGISSFGEDEAGELYLADLFGNRIYKIVPDTSTDTDGDTVPDSTDNCPGVPNTNQANADRNFTDLSPTKVYDDLTLPNSDGLGDECDSDDDNDGLSDALEGTFPMSGCGAASTATSETLRDTDGDYALDGAECALGFDPASPASKPPPNGYGTGVDSDSDRLPNTLDPDDVDVDIDNDAVLDGIEFTYYNTGYTAGMTNTDGDGCGDAREIASINADQTVNSIDLSQVAQSFSSTTAPPYFAHMDLNHDDKVNSIDLQFVAGRFGACP